ncbi:MAG: IPT/TIG domain-containing protein [Ignavibacterium sp.]|nr:IPT/TIG domain-containing protein [Ignavibacterium sp.]
MIKLYKYLGLIILTALFLSACSEDPYSGLDELIDLPTTPPSIDSIEPSNGGLAGITVLTINGSNFSSDPAKNMVYFNGVKGEILTATSTQLKVRPPNVISDSVQVKASVFKVEDFSNIMFYKLAPAAVEIFKFDPANNGTPYALTVDANENVYTSVAKQIGAGIFKLDPQGNLSLWAPNGAESFFSSLTFGPSSVIYGARRVRAIFQASEGIPSTIYVNLTPSGGGNANDSDFDQNLNLWVGANGNILSITPAKVVQAFPFDGNINAIKIFNGAIYAVATSNNQQILWKVPVISADNIGTPEVYFNFSAEVDSVIKLNDISIAADGDIYIGTDAKKDPIYVIHSDKSFEKLYPGILNSSVNSLCWGAGNFLYMTRNSLDNLTQTIIRIDMEKPGAPYFGR